MRLAVPGPIADRAMVMIESGDTRFFGEVVYCGQTSTEWSVGVEVEQRFQDTLQLQRLRQTLAGAGIPSVAPELARKTTPVEGAPVEAPDLLVNA